MEVFKSCVPFFLMALQLWTLEAALYPGSADTQVPGSGAPQGLSSGWKPPVPSPASMISRRPPPVQGFTALTKTDVSSVTNNFNSRFVPGYADKQRTTTPSPLLQNPQNLHTFVQLLESLTNGVKRIAEQSSASSPSISPHEDSTSPLYSYDPSTHSSSSHSSIPPRSFTQSNQNNWQTFSSSGSSPTHDAFVNNVNLSPKSPPYRILNGKSYSPNQTFNWVDQPSPHPVQHVNYHVPVPGPSKSSTNAAGYFHSHDNSYPAQNQHYSNGGHFQRPPNTHHPPTPYSPNHNHLNTNQYPTTYPNGNNYDNNEYSTIFGVGSQSYAPQGQHGRYHNNQYQQSKPHTQPGYFSGSSNGQSYYSQQHQQPLQPQQHQHSSWYQQPAGPPYNNPNQQGYTTDQQFQERNSKNSQYSRSQILQAIRMHFKTVFPNGLPPSLERALNNAQPSTPPKFQMQQMPPAPPKPQHRPQPQSQQQPPPPPRQQRPPPMLPPRQPPLWSAPIRQPAPRLPQRPPPMSMPAQQRATGYNYFGTGYRAPLMSGSNECSGGFVPGQLCCDGITNMIPPGGQGQFQCCHKGMYNTSSQLCCGDMPVPKPHKATHMLCCGTMLYDPRTHICCDKAPYPNQGGAVQCCRKRPFNPSREMCCGESVKPRLPQNRGMDCCGKHMYNPATHICCEEGNTFYKAPGVQCCGKNQYRPQFEQCCFGDTLPKGTHCFAK